MKLETFQKLLTQCTERTQHVRTINKWTSSGVSRIPDEITSKIDGIVSLLEDNIKKGLLCAKDEYLMIYNFQPLYVSETIYLCSLDMLIRPKSKIADLGNCEGKPLQLIVDGMNGKVADNAYAEQMLELYDDEEEEEEEVVPTPVCYGNYFDYSEPKTPLSPCFAEKLAILDLINSVYSGPDRVSSTPANDTKAQKEKEFESPKLDDYTRAAEEIVPIALTYSFDSFDASKLVDDLSPTSASILSSMMGSGASKSDLPFMASSMLSCKA